MPDVCIKRHRLCRGYVEAGPAQSVEDGGTGYHFCMHTRGCAVLIKYKTVIMCTLRLVRGIYIYENH